MMKEGSRDMVETMIVEDISIQKNVPVQMRDGTTLYADIYRPNNKISYPILILRTPYNKEDAQTMNYAHPTWYAKHGYVVIVQDTRGRWSSEGEFQPLKFEGQDGYDTIQWAIELPYTIPKVGLYGFSYNGFSQLLTAAEQPPGLCCIAPFMCGADTLSSSDNGAFPLAQNLSWSVFVSINEAVRKKDEDWLKQWATTNIQDMYRFLPLQNAPIVKKELAPFYEDLIQQHDQPPKSANIYENIAVPALHLGGWYDIYIEQTIKNFHGIREKSKSKFARENQFLILTPWFHMPWSPLVGEIDFGEKAKNRVDEWQIKWFNRWLKGDERNWDLEPVQYFVTGENEWHTTFVWSIPNQVKKTLYLYSENRSNSINGDGKLIDKVPTGGSDKDMYVYHPSISVPAIGGRSGPDPVQTPMGACNQLPIEIRNDVLVYTSDILKEDLVVTGEIKAKLYISTTVEDTDFAIKLTDVYPDGRSINVAEGLLRLSARNGIHNRLPVIPDKVYFIEISAGSIAHRFKKGHAIRMDITSSMFPIYDRNSNQFIPIHEATELSFKTATQSVYHSKDYPSRIEFYMKEDVV